MTAVSAPSGAVYDRGYRPYEGERGGRRAATMALYKASMRRALGLRRSWRQKVAPFLLLGIVTIPVMVNVGIGYVTRDSGIGDRLELFTYREYVGVSNALFLFVAIAGPDIICPDRRQRVLPLLFARPLTGADYVLAKVGALFTILFMFSFLPQVVLFLGYLFVSDGAMGYLKDNAEVIWQVPVSVALLAAFYSVMSVAIASVAKRRIVAGASFIGLFLVTSTIAAILIGERAFFEDGSMAGLINLAEVPLYLRDLVFLGDISSDSSIYHVEHAAPLAVAEYAAIVAAGIGFLLWRYRWTER